MNKEDLYALDENEQHELDNFNICDRATFQALLDEYGDKLDDERIINAVVTTGKWDRKKDLKTLGIIFAKFKAKQGLIESSKEAKEQEADRFVDEVVKKAKRAYHDLPTGVVERPDGYEILDITKDGRVISRRLTNFVFKNIRKVQMDSEEKVLLVDIICETQAVGKNIILDADRTVERKKLLATLRKQVPEANIITTKTEEIDELMTHVAKKAQRTAIIEDYMGMFYHKESEKYYYVVNKVGGGYTYIKPSTMNVPDSDLVLIKGRRHESNQVSVRNVLSDTSWYNAATELLSIVPASLKNHKSLLMLSWFFAALVSPWMHRELGLKLPILFIYGEPGSGKSTNLNLITTFFGNPNNDSVSMSSTNQPIRDAMSCTNAFAMLTTEYNDKANNITSIIFMLKTLYDRSSYSRGQLDRNDNYPLQAPWIMQGNMRVNNQAVQERMLQILIQKSDQSLDRKTINQALQRKLENTKFIEGYLPYLLDRQDQWKDWHEKALLYVPEDIDSRQLDITTTLTIGLMMIQDLRRTLGMAEYTAQEIGQVIGQITQSRLQNQIQPQHVLFLEHLQTYHTDPQIYSKKVNGVSETYGFVFNQAWWLNKYEDFCRGKGNDFDKNVILEGLKMLGVTTNKTISVRGNKAKCIAFNPHELEKATQGIIEADAWVENPLQIVVDYDFKTESEDDAKQPKLTIN
ncbi:hypothetical protein ACTNDP_12530 [Paenibacillus barengoltzii]|uniref:hypothetical protein n=1 Tax=Paenibacillus barengoltzii TaxID=343517 RepID=UPI003F89B3ED